MFDERAFIAKVESSDTDKLTEYLKRPTLEEEKALRAHLGDARYQRMHSMALRKSNASSYSRGVSPTPQKNVVVIHGIMGGELTTMNRSGSGEQVWVKAFRIMRGWLSRLRLNDDGSAEYDSDYDVHASGIMKRYYGELLLKLSINANVRAFWFDWRKDLQVAANDLDAKINGWFSDQPVHLVAHSMGGLVARTFIKKFPKRWETMKGEGQGPDGMELGGRLVMLGTPNYGSFSIPQVLTGIEGLVKKLTMLDFRHDSAQLLEVFNSFVGTYQMLPSPFKMKDMEKLYNAGIYPNSTVMQRHLDNAKRHHDFLRDVIDAERMIYIAGSDQPTFNDINDFNKLGSLDSYNVTRKGDGRVPHELGLLDGVQTYYVREEHGNLSSNADILDVLDELLSKGKEAATTLSKDPILGTRGLGDADNRKQLKVDFESDRRQMEIARSRMGTRGVNQMSADDPKSVAEDQDDAMKSQTLSPEERKVEEILTRGFLSRQDDARSANDNAEDQKGTPETIEVEIGLELCGIQNVHEKKLRGSLPDAIDAISVGHYIGVPPQNAELALDKEISKYLHGKVGTKTTMPDGASEKKAEVSEADLVLTQYTNRGIIHGRLGQPFFFPDPRLDDQASDRTIAIVGMGESGRFGVPELTVTVRELCWSLGRMGKNHLATVMIGAGAGNIPQRDAFAAWIDGIKRAVAGSADDKERCLKRITFVEYDPRYIRRLEKIILEEKARQDEENNEASFQEQPFKVSFAYEKFTPAELEAIDEKAKSKIAEVLKKEIEDEKNNQEFGSDSSNQPPTRVTLGLDAERKTYRFGAITANASVPERDVKIDPALIWQANDELAGEQKHAMQLERGRFLEGLLMPNDLRQELYGNAPLVMMLDSTTARIHWEMVAQPEVGGLGGNALRQDDNFNKSDFLGTARGFTRQLRTTFAPPPEPPPPPRRILRVLVVADPAADAHLPGAQEEGVAVADLFESFNTIYKDNPSSTRVEVVRLFGPLEATRTNVLRELTVRSYDVLHFAGHCVYQWDGDPTMSGWVFNRKNKELLTANELNRIDRIPKFVFSNACESGITPDRSQERAVDLAPSFAEAFFARGVSNFVCTAWPVNDVAAQRFALKVYAGLLGIKLKDKKAEDSEEESEGSGDDGSKPEDNTDGKADAQKMFEAMRDARYAIAKSEAGVATWGAYQHYGNPYFQLFNTPKDGTSSETGKVHDNGAAARGKSAKEQTATKKNTTKKNATKKSGTSRKRPVARAGSKASSKARPKR